MSVNKKVKIKNKDGIHARPSSLIVESASSYSCSITLSKNGQSGDAKNMLDLMVLGMREGDEVEITCHGNEEKQALKRMTELLTTEYNYKKN